MSLLLQTFCVPALLGEQGEIRLNAKELALLVYLRVTGRPHTRGAVGQLLWGKTAHGRNNSVNTAISALRRALPEGALPTGADPVVLAADLPCDVDAVLNATRGTGGHEDLLNALRTHRAPFLDGFEFQLGSGAEEFIEWMQARRATFADTLAQALEDGLAAAAASGDWTNVRALARAGRESLAEWKGYGDWMDRANRARGRSRRGVAGAAVAACAVVVFLLMRLSLAGAARTCEAGEARAQLVRQVYPAEANHTMREGERYTPAWYLRNVGTCAWRPGARVVRVGAFGPAPLGTDTSARNIPQAVEPGQQVKVEVRMRGPRPVGRYGEDWVLLDASGKRVAMEGGATLQVRFRVLPRVVATCRAGEVAADQLAESHPLENMRVRPGEQIPVSWTLFNDGDCAWDSTVSLRFREASGPRLSDPDVSSIRLRDEIPPSEGYTFHVPMRAPQAEGSHLELWELVGPDGRAVRVSDRAGVDVRIVVSRTDQARATEPECTPGDEVVAFLPSETVRDGSTVAPGARVRKEWTLQNIGDCTWPAGALRLKRVRSEPEFPHRPLPDVVTDRPVPPTGTYTFRAPFTAPSAPRHYRVRWQMYNRAGDSVIVSQTWTIWADFHVRDER